jgi:hypothetical protein
MEMKDKKLRWIRIYSIITGFLYLILGSLQAAHGFGLKMGFEEFLLVPEDSIGGLVLIVIGLVFLFGALRGRRAPQEGNAFALVGTVLGLLFAVIYILILLADVMEALVIVNEEWAEWTILDSLRPGIYLGVLVLMGFLIFRKELTFREQGDDQDA